MQLEYLEVPKMPGVGVLERQIEVFLQYREDAFECPFRFANQRLHGRQRIVKRNTNRRLAQSCLEEGTCRRHADPNYLRWKNEADIDRARAEFFLKSLKRCRRSNQDSG